MFRHSYYIRRLLHHRLLGRYLLLTNTVSSCALDALGDALEQRVERVNPHDWPRTLRFGTVGLLMGPIDHYWYRYLDFHFPGVRATTIAKKVTLDMLVLSPFQILLFYLLVCKLEGKSWKETVKETRQKFMTTFELDLLLWPAVQVVNFRYVPASLRVLFQNVFYVVWIMVLSYLKHHEITGRHIWNWKE